MSTKVSRTINSLNHNCQNRDYYWICNISSYSMLYQLYMKN